METQIVFEKKEYESRLLRVKAEILFLANKVNKSLDEAIDIALEKHLKEYN